MLSPNGGTVSRGLPYNVFWDVDHASSVSKMLDASNVFYPGRDRPFSLDGDEITYLECPTQVEIVGSLEGGGETSVTYAVQAQRPRNISLIQTGFHLGNIGQTSRHSGALLAVSPNGTDC